MSKKVIEKNVANAAAFFLVIHYFTIKIVLKMDDTVNAKNVAVKKIKGRVLPFFNEEV